MSTSPISMHVLISDYERQVAPTDRFLDADVTPILLGLFGELGSVMSTSKKFQREKAAFAGYKDDVEEEFGDTLWYVAALCRRLGIKLSDLFIEALEGTGFADATTAGGDAGAAISGTPAAVERGSLDSILLRLGEHAAQLLQLDATMPESKQLLIGFIQVYWEALEASTIDFTAILKTNIAKARGRFLAPNKANLPDFDASFPPEEQLPRQFEIEITQRPNGRSYLRWKGVFIGDPLTDNISDPDGYRFHDVFHFANAAILHWSPTFRALIKHKRKSQPAVDEGQDSGRAIVIDEGVSAYIFSYAKQLDFFEGQSSVSFDLLKTVRNFVRGYEVELCPLNLWENAILQGYEVFRQVRLNNGGIVIGDRENRTLAYRPVV